MTTVFINEFHYDNNGSDTNEFIELAGLAGTDLNGWNLVLYNGNGGGVYDTVDLSSSTFTDESNGFGFVTIDFPSNGIQNGSPDGFALVDAAGDVVQFLSYEGSFTAVGGAADDLTSTDIGVSESGTTPVGFSLQLTGTGSTAADFTWADPADDTPGAANNGQTFSGGSGTTLAIAPTDAVKAEGDAGNTSFTFTITRTGDTTGATSVDFAVSGDADAADFGGTLPSGTVNFAANDTSQVVTVNVSGDTDSETDESFTVTLSNPTGGATITTATANGTIQNDDGVAFTPISTIQGSGASSPIQGQTVTIEAVVVGDFQDGASGTNGDLNGFFVQEEDADADADLATSEGIFIFDDSSPAVDVNIGDIVQVTGEVGEAFGQTQLASPSVTVVSSTNPLPTPATVNFPVTAVDDLEAFEGMQITIPDTLFVTEYFNLDRFGEVVLASDGASNEPGTDGRLDQYTDFNAPDVAGFAAYQDAIATRRIVLDDGQTIQNPDPIILGRGGNPLSATNTLRGGDTVDNLSGVLSFGFGDYRIQPTAPVDFQPTNPRPEMPEDVGGDLKVTSFNVLNFFTTLDVSGNPGSGPNNLEPRGADNQAEFDRQVEKLVTTLEDIDADIIGLIELENEFGDQNGDGQFAIDTLVDELNNRVGAGTYAYVDPGVPFVDTGDAISVGAIYKTSTVQIAPGTTVEILTDSDLPALGLSGTVFDGVSTNRAPIAVSFEELSTGEVFTVSVNHFKSKGGTGSGDDADIGDGQGNFNGTRLRGSQALEAWLETDPTGSGDDDFLIIGDLNAYAEEDPITFLEGQGYTDLIEEFVGNDAYSFVFDGQFGYLDYGLANQSLLSQVTGTTEWHINADEPDAFDYNLDFGRDPSLFDGQDPFRASDHDPVIIGLDLFSTAVATTGDDDLILTSDSETLDALAGNDTIRARGGNDNLFGNDGADRLLGQNGNDTLDGGAGNDILNGGNGNDLLIGGSENDRLFGADGSDTLIGVDENLSNPGAGELDILRGDSGADLYVLGNATTPFYDDDATTVAEGRVGRAVIREFEIGVDQIQLHGTASDYELRTGGGNTIIFETTGSVRELIGVVLGTTGLDLSDSSIFSFV